MYSLNVKNVKHVLKRKMLVINIKSVIVIINYLQIIRHFLPVLNRLLFHTDSV